MSVLVDTSILVRLANSADVLHPIALSATLKLHRQGETLCVTPQNLIEFHSVATRPVNVNGLGLSPAGAEQKAAIFETAFKMLPESPDLYPAWKVLAQTSGVIGKQVHDARLLAFCEIHKVPKVLTFNVAHFTTLGSFTSGIMVLDPATV